MGQVLYRQDLSTQLFIILIIIFNLNAQRAAGDPRGVPSAMLDIMTQLCQLPLEVCWAWLRNQTQQRQVPVPSQTQQLLTQDAMPPVAIVNSKHIRATPPTPHTQLAGHSVLACSQALGVCFQGRAAPPPAVFATLYGKGSLAITPPQPTMLSAKHSHVVVPARQCRICSKTTMDVHSELCLGPHCMHAQ